MGKVSKLSPVPSLAKLRGSNGTPPTSSNPLALRAVVLETDACWGAKAAEVAARVARTADVNLVMVEINVGVIGPGY